ncbi:hypothetical protein LTR91_025077 [Friedmanniomyces endolithicus]|uniref:BRCT domain-containing protein n=1 Tax=Friedmanniomyces endolithicus TaxID=329885 RepID=A0AAN6JWB4_9PEZI|nr:hypothetical protein LTR75_016760 [Friedmanniomyces endolithicus]KAK0841602.1 hypothetical protein LTS02_016791 [Friedmanniomyces endolithicus]KAK0866601.1 hypothetical protein LTR87_014948 [Friedmanniomyces endolithicus]KAK0891955.1 hypothetical protein LTR02_013696 [Friedmanniomyces endolithicus]KAK0951302.1 hypothetical protein LTR91_025077 [Friedmanniomyces endolithicus]
MPATGCLKNTTITLIQPLEVYDPKWTKASLDRWIGHAKGRAITKFTSNTTHVVCTEKAYQQQTGDIRAAVVARKKGERFHIVSPEWLAETLSQQKRAKESEFSWEKLAKSSGGKRKKKKKGSSDVEDEEEEAVVKRPKTAGGLLREVFQEHTEQFVSEGERRALRGVFEREEEVKRQAVLAEEKERREIRAKAEKEAVFRKGAKKARNEIFSDNHHIYMDVTGFKYDIILTKVDARLNRNERYALTIYESNSTPNTYATNLHYAGTGIQSSNNVIAALGCRFKTAFHAFRKVFKEKTKGEWDERMSQVTGKAEGSVKGSVKGRAVGESEVVAAQQAFIYTPPLYGPKGLLPEKRKVVTWPPGPALPVPTTGYAGEGARSAEEVEMWINGAAGGDGPTPAGDIVAEPAGHNGMTDYDAFMSGQFRTDAQAAEAGEAAISATLPEDLGATGFPFTAADDPIFLGGVTAEPSGMVLGEVDSAGGSLLNAQIVEDGHAFDVGVGNAAQQEFAAEMAPETQNGDATQLASDAEMGLEAFMEGVHEAAAAKFPSESAAAATEPASELGVSDLPTDETPAVDLGKSLLGKPKASSPAAVAEIGVEIEVEAGEIEEKDPKHARLTSARIEPEEQEEEQEDLTEFHDALAEDEMMVDGDAEQDLGARESVLGEVDMVPRVLTAENGTDGGKGGEGTITGAAEEIDEQVVGENGMEKGVDV